MKRRLLFTLLQAASRARPIVSTKTKQLIIPWTRQYRTDCRTVAINSKQPLILFTAGASTGSSTS